MKILLVDDHELFGASLKMALENSLEAIEELRVEINYLNVMETVKNFEPDIVLLDIHLGKADGIKVCKQLLGEWPELKVIFLSGYDLAEFHAQARKIGAKGFVNKNCSLDRLIESILDVLNGKVLFNEEEEEAEDILTPREIEVLKLIAEGYKQKEIADMLDISIRTVRHHIFAITQKFGVDSSVSAIIEGMRKGIFPII